MIKPNSGILGGPLVAVFTMGVVFPFANQKGAISGALVGCLCGWAIFLGSKSYPHSDFLLNKIPTRANYTSCPADWVSDVDTFLSGKPQTNKRTSDNSTK